MTGRAGAEGFILPTAEQTMLLHAALDTDGAAVDHFERWHASVDLDRALDRGSFNTLPLLWSTLSAKGHDHPLMPRLKGIFRNSWVKATRRHAATERLLGALREDGIPTLALKGLPLAYLYYPKPALRPMQDIDIAVPAEQAERASAAFERGGFAAQAPNWRVDRVLRHALQHKDAEGNEADLHWHVLFETPTRSADAHFWGSAVPLAIGAETTLQPCPTDLLLHVIVHGIRWNPSPPMRWVADAAMILRSEPGIDWQRLAGFARAHRLGRRVALGLALLKEEFRLSIPPATIAALERSGSLVERVEFLGMRGESERSAWRHVRRGSFVLRLMQADRAAALPLALAREALSRARRRLAPGRKASAGAG